MVTLRPSPPCSPSGPGRGQDVVAEEPEHGDRLLGGEPRLFRAGAHVGLGGDGSIALLPGRQLGPGGAHRHGEADPRGDDHQSRERQRDGHRGTILAPNLRSRYAAEGGHASTASPSRKR